MNFISHKFINKSLHFAWNFFLLRDLQQKKKSIRLLLANAVIRLGSHFKIELLNRKDKFLLDDLFVGIDSIRIFLIFSEALIFRSKQKSDYLFR